MKVLSLFDGISCGRLAFQRAKIKVEKYYSSEIDAYAMQITQKNFPDTIQVGDVNKLNYLELLDVDIVIGGSPCQDLSIAKQNREGLHGERSKLFWKYIEALEVIRPKWFLLENVASMRNEDCNAITETLRKLYPETECIMINSALVSAQQRKRYYWTNWHVEQPADKRILLKDILENGYELNEKSHCIDANYHKGASLEHYAEKRNRELVAMPIRGDKARAVISSVGRTTEREYFKKHQSTMVAEPVRIGTLSGLGTGQANRIYSVRGKSVCLNANGGGGGAKTGLYKVDLPDGDYTIRKLTPLECERLQTLPDNYTEGISATQRYKAIGNAWTVDVIAHILKQLPQ